MDRLLDALLDAGIWGLVVVLVALILRPLYAQVLARDVKRFEQAGQRELEQLRAELRLAGLEQETKLVRLHERRAEVLHELYGRLSRLTRAFVSLVRPLQEGGEPSQEEKALEVADSANNFLDYFDERRIYLDQPLCELLDRFSFTVHQTWVEFTTYREEDPKRAEAWIKAWKKLTDEVPPIRREIEARFRQILGVKDSE